MCSVYTDTCRAECFVYTGTFRPEHVLSTLTYLDWTVFFLLSVTEVDSSVYTGTFTSHTCSAYMGMFRPDSVVCGALGALCSVRTASWRPVCCLPWHIYT